MSDRDAIVRRVLATDADLDRVLEEQVINLPYANPAPPIDYDAMSLAELLDDLVWAAKPYYLGEENYEAELAAARTRVDERLKKIGLL